MNTAQATYIDGLRGGAAQLVLFGHIYSMILYPGHTTGLGDLGVIIFFILSGFLITYTSLIKKDYNFKKYFLDRFFRIFVPYIPAVLFIIIIDTYIFNYTASKEYLEHYNLKDLLATLTMLQQHPVGLFMDKLLGISELKLATFGSGRPLWTVAIEWWLYIMFSFILFYKRDTNRFFIKLFLFLIISIVPVFNFVAGTGQGLSLVWFIMSGIAYWYYTSGQNIADLMKKILVSGKREKFLLYLLLMGLAVLMVIRFLWISYIETDFVFSRPVFYDFNLYVLLIIFLSLIFCILSVIKSQKRNKIILFFADYSYSLYLIHYTLLYFLLSSKIIGGNNVMLDFMVCYLVTNLVAIVFWWMFERNHKLIKQYIINKFGLISQL